jgi:hypothetical protein
MKKILVIIVLSFSLLSSSLSEEPQIIEKSINGLLKDGYKILKDEIIGGENSWGIKVVTLKKKNDYIVCTMILDANRPRPSKCIKP